LLALRESMQVQRSTAEESPCVHPKFSPSRSSDASFGVSPRPVISIHPYLLLSGLFSASCILPQPSSRDLASPPQGPPSPPCRSTSVVDQRQALTFAHLNRISPNVIGKPCLSFLARARLMSCRLAVAETYSTRRRRKAAMVIYRSTTDTFFSSDERNKKDRARRENVRLRTRFVRVRNRYMLCSSGRRRT
jgi:hypothetical protein